MIDYEKTWKMPLSELGPDLTEHVRANHRTNAIALLEQLLGRVVFRGKRKR